MPSIGWICENCEEKNPPYTEECRSCSHMAPSIDCEISQPTNVVPTNAVPTSINRVESTDAPDSFNSVLVIVIWGLGAFVSFFMAVLSVNETVIGIFLAINILCLVLAISLISAKKTALAFLAALSSVPVSFGLVVLFMK